jgi:hypothetical protein
MNREELIQLCRQAPDIGAVRHEEFVNYITLLDQVRRVNGQWEKTEAAYMSVDGKVAMANEDHRRQGKQLNFEDPVILVEDESQLTLLVAVVSEIYGRRHGIATSRKSGGSPYEAAHPWEVAETSAIGRALSVMGYGVLPGSGLASADDVSRAREAESNAHSNDGARRESPGRTSNGFTRRGQRGVSAFQRQKIFELFGELYEERDVESGVDALFEQEVGHPLEEASYDEGRQLTAYLLREKRALHNRALEPTAN